MPRRRRFSGRRSVRRGASRFAGATVSGGRQRNWISLSQEQSLGPAALPTATFAGGSRVVGADTILFVTILPQNIASGGVVTVQRIVGNVWVYQEVVGSEGLLDTVLINQQWLALSIQLVPIREGAISVEFPLDTNNASDLDSQNILWRHYYGPAEQPSGALRTIANDGVANRGWVNIAPPTAIDIKSMRKWDRSQFALIFVCTCRTADLTDYMILHEFRGLMLQQGSLG